MSRRAYLYFAFTFLLGAILGASGVFFYAWNTGHWHRGPNRERVVRRLKNELNLSPMQVQQLRQIMDDEGRRFENLQKQAEPQYQAIREETGNRIRQILSPEQTAKFNDMVRRWDERRRRRTH
jgi:Spy/CpxP family protein refolding chaperone